jgi:hypothetical protein
MCVELPLNFEEILCLDKIKLKIPIYAYFFVSSNNSTISLLTMSKEELMAFNDIPMSF